MRRSALLLALSLALAPTAALANGRFPAANQLALGPSRLVVRTTFGLLLADQPAGPFGWTCEQAFGVTDDQDPPLALFGDQRLVVAPLSGAFGSDDAGCSFAAASGLGAGEVLLDVSAEKNDPSRGLALTWKASDRITRVYGTSDHGATWQPRGQVPETDGVPTTLDGAPSKPERVAVAGAFSRQGALWGYVSVSDDGGKTWKARAEALLEDAKGLYLAAIDPEQPDRIYARTSGGAEDRLLVSEDGGTSLAELSRVPGAMQGFALSPDGAQVAVGGPTAGVRVAARGSSSFASVRTAPVSCLGWRQDGLYACGSGLAGDFALGRSPDAGATWQPLLARLADVRAPDERCAAASPVASTCGPLWPAQHAKLDAIGSAAGQGGAAGSAGAGGEGGVGGQGAGGEGSGGLGGEGGAAGEGGSEGVAPPAGESDCGCRGAGGSGRGWAWALWALGLFSGLRRRTMAKPGAR